MGFVDKKRGGIWHIVYWLPVVLPIMLAVFSFVAILLLVLDSYKTVLIWGTGTPLALLVAAIFYKVAPEKKNIDRENKVATAIAVVLAVAWVGVNAMYTSQHVHTDRDPATYAVASMILSREDNLRIQTGGELRDVEGAIETSAGFGASRVVQGEIYAQGAHLLPALLSLVGRMFGDSVMLHAPPVFGGLALLAVYGFARILVRPRWALVSMSTFAVSMPLLYFSRDTYTEPLMATFVFGALSVIALAYKQRSTTLWMLAGLVTGASLLVRVDAVLSVVGLTVGVLLYALLAVKKRDRFRGIIAVLAFIVPVALGILLSYLDLTLLSSGYFRHQSDKIVAQYTLYVSMIIVWIVAVSLVWGTRVLKWLDTKTQSWRGVVAAVAVIGTGLFLALRPLWQISHRETPIGLTGGLQERDGLPIDLFRDYAEQTVNWMIWYIGPVLVVFALVGLAIVAKRAVTQRNVIWMTVLATVAAVALLYFIKPSITPDQIWASRRFLPVVMPGIAILGALGLAWLYERNWKPLGISLKIPIVVLATLAVTFPLMVSYPVLAERTYGSQLAQVNDVCNSIGDKSNTIILWVGFAGHNMLQPVETVCGIDGYRLRDEDRNIEGDGFLSEVYDTVKNSNKKVIVGVYGDQLGIIPERYRDNMVSISATEFKEYEQNLLQPPKGVRVVQRSILVGQLSEGGDIVRYANE